MIRYSITFTGLETLGSAVSEQVMPLMAQAVSAVSEKAAENWQSAILGAKLWSGEKDAYRQSITIKKTGPYSAFIGSNYKYAAEIETGRPPRDLKKMLDTSKKVRRTKDGRRFLVIPIQHGLPKSNSKPMPSGVAKLAKAMTPSKVVSTGMRPSGQVTHLSPTSGMSTAAKQTPYLSNRSTKSAMLTENRSYQWGDRISKAQLKAAGASKDDQRKYAGMVRMNQTVGGVKRSGYLTFRIMMEGSRGWIVPAQPGQYILKKVVTDLEPQAQAAFQRAMDRTRKG